MVNIDGIIRLIERISNTYTNPREYLDGLGRQIIELHSDIDDSTYEKYLNVLEKELKKISPDQVLTIANKGLFLGTLADDIGYNVKVIEAHHAIHPYWKRRSKEILWYYINPLKVIDEIKIIDTNNLATISREPSESSKETKVFKVGIIDVDEVEPDKRTGILDDCIDEGLVMSAVRKYVLDKNSLIAGSIVFSKGCSQYPNVVELDKLLE